MTGEFARIARYFAPLAGPAALGLTDDAALWTPPDGQQLVLTVDQLIETIHFLPDDPPDCIARKLLRRNLSDLAAMGATPTGYLLTTALRADTPESWLASFAEGLKQDQILYDIELFGGDSASTHGPITLSVTMIGHVTPGQALRRSGARADDAIYVTGSIGDAALGLHVARNNLTDPSGRLNQRRLLPEPRVGLKLHEVVHAAIDISDGLMQDLFQICRSAGVAADVCAELVPIADAAKTSEVDWLIACVTGGDDYELILAAPASAETVLRQLCSPVPVARIGSFRNGPPEVILLSPDGKKLELPRLGWRHF